MISEHQLQKTAIEYLDLSSYKHCYFAIPNGAKRSIGCAAWMKSEGLKRGVPDLFIASASGNFHGLFIEFKSKTGRVSDHQKSWMKTLEINGYAVAVARSIDEFIEIILKYEKLNEK